MDPAELAEQLLTAARKPMVHVYPIRINVNFLPGANIEDCMAHYRTEKAARVAPEAPLKVTDLYNDWLSRFSLFVHTPDSDWEEQGATIVAFDFSSDLYGEEL